jgi:hypothetical protein
MTREQAEALSSDGWVFMTNYSVDYVAFLDKPEYNDPDYEYLKAATGKPVFIGGKMTASQAYFDTSFSVWRRKTRGNHGHINKAIIV